MDILYSCSLTVYSFFNVYILHRFNRSFFGTCITPRYIELGSYFFIFLSNTIISLWINIPIVILLCNVIGYYLLTYNYQGDQKHRVFLPLIYICITTLAELIIFFLSTYTPIQISEINSYNFAFGPVFSAILSYAIVKILIALKSSSAQIKLPLTHWLLLLVIPLVSFYLILLIMSFEDANPKTVALCCILALIINFVAFYFYEVVTAYAISKMEKQREEEKNRYYLRQLETMEAFSESMRSFRHDLKNHTIAMQAYLKNKQYDALEAYLSNTFIEKALSEESIHCGNTVIDSILNFKIHEAGNKGITLEAKVSIPPQLHISDSDLTVILGNLLDNAIEAVEPLTEERVIQLTISYQKGNLILSVKNPYKGELLKKGDRWITSKKDKDLHGYGLSNVKHIVDKNGGTMRIQTEQQIFSVTMMLYDTNTDESH